MNHRGLTLLSLLVLAALIAGPGGCDKLVTEEVTQNTTDSTLGQACLTCHTDNSNLILRPKAQWENSKHFTSVELIDIVTTIDTKERSVTQCGPQCHTNEGYIKTFDNGSVSIANGYSAIGCYTCHMPHSGPYGTWDIDTLRALENFTVLANDSVFRMGKANMCVNCHQAKNAEPKTTADVQLDVDEFGPHFGAQADVLNGTGGFRFGTITAPTNNHRTAVTQKNGCLACHFGSGQGYDYGQHTFRLESDDASYQFVNNCNVSGCHSSSPITDFYAFASVDSIQMLADSIGTALQSRGYLLGDGVSFTADSTVTSLDAKLLYNYLLYKLDGSRGVHNPEYMLELLKQSAARVDSLVPILNFTSTTRQGCAPYTTTFDASGSRGENLVWQWNFGDGTTPGTDSVETHTYDTSGVYSLQVILSNGTVADTATLPNLVTVYTIPVAAFTLSDSVAAPSDTITFTNASGLVQSLNWIITDSSGALVKDTTTINGAELKYPFTSAGLYTVSLVASNICGSDSTGVADAIRISTTLFGERLDPTPPRRK